MTPEKKLFDILQCPNCSSEALNENSSYITCASCKSIFPINSGIPDMRIYESSSCRNEFNIKQAKDEAELHDLQAPSLYERAIIRTFGTKTRMIAQDWVRVIGSIYNNPVVLDYGCGTGQVSQVLCRHLYPLFAFDISEGSLKKNVSNNNVIGVLANSLFLPFKDKVFDIVCINGVLHHIVDLDRAIKEIARVSNKYVFVSEGIPKARNSFSRAHVYPKSTQQFWYIAYIILYIYSRSVNYFNRLSRRTLSAVLRESYYNLSSSRQQSVESIPIESIHEKPLSTQIVVNKFMENDFRVKQFRYFTNIDIPGDGLIKRFLTKALINDVVGTHFDMQLERI